VIPVTARVSLRLPSGRFPKGSYAAALKSIVEPFRKQTEDAFDRERDPVTGIGWARERQPLTPVGRKLLDKTGTLKKRTLSAVTLARITGNTLTIRQRQPHYWKYHAFGTVNMKRRRTVGAGPTVKKLLAKALKREAVKIITTPRRGG
jgi:hypothetical protein